MGAFKVATSALVDIEDVANEITMIKRVYQDQANVWKALHKLGYNDGFMNLCKCRQEDMPSHVYTVLTRLEEDAQKVRASVRYRHRSLRTVT